MLGRALRIRLRARPVVRPAGVETAHQEVARSPGRQGTRHGQLGRTNPETRKFSKQVSGSRAAQTCNARAASARDGSTRPRQVTRVRGADRSPRRGRNAPRGVAQLQWATLSLCREMSSPAGVDSLLPLVLSIAPASPAPTDGSATVPEPRCVIGAVASDLLFRRQRGSHVPFCGVERLDDPIGGRHRRSS